MANPTYNTGLRPKKRYDSMDSTGSVIHCHVRSDYATALHVGSPVAFVAGSNTAVVTTATTRYPIGTLKNINLASLGTSGVIAGVIIGFKNTRANIGQLYGPASTTRVAVVDTDTNQIFEIRDDGANALTTATTAGLNGCLIAGTANTDGSCSGVRLDSGTTSAPAATSTFQLHIIGPTRTDDGTNAVDSINQLWDVTINQPQAKPLATGV